MRVRFFACWIAGLAALVLGQSTESAEPRPMFEAADVHAATPVRNPFMRGPFNRGGHYEIHNGTMVELIAAAYNMNANEVVGGPNWLEMDRFDVIAKTPPNTSMDTARLMLRSLLADRFKLEIRSDARSVPALALVAGKRPQLKESTGEGEPQCKFVSPPPPPRNADGTPPPPPTFTYECRHMPMERFAVELRNMFDFDTKPVIDRTAMKGAWDFDMKATFQPGSDFAMVQEIADKQLGLKLEAVTTPFPVMVVDRVNQKPTPNVPNIVELLHLPPEPTEFEVAELKPTSPDFQGRRLQIQNGGRVNVGGVTPKFLIQQAWNLTDDMLIGAPKWMDQDRYDIIAKVSTTTRADIDLETLWVLLRNLLKERFQIEWHQEQRELPAYTLLASKPKMQKADPTSRTKFKEGPGNDGKDPRNKNAILSRLVTVQNMTMDQFSVKLQEIAPGYIRTPVLNATNLEGSYDFTLSFSPAGALQPNGGGRGGANPQSQQPAAAAGDASDPSGAVSLFDAIDRQLGLKLQQQKRSVTVLVIDKATQKPTEN